MPEIEHRLGDRLHTLVADEEPSPTFRMDFEEQLRRPAPRRKTAPRGLAMATVAATLVVGAFALAGIDRSSDSDQRVLVTPASSPASGLPHGRSNTRVLTSNATETPQTAQEALRRLQAAGYIGVGAMDAPESRAGSRVYFRPGYEAEARDVARLLGLDESAVDRPAQSVPEPNGADVLVIVGEDLS